MRVVVAAALAFFLCVVLGMLGVIFGDLSGFDASWYLP